MIYFGVFSQCCHLFGDRSHPQLPHIQAPGAKHSARIAETFPQISSSLQLCFQEGHYCVFVPLGFNSLIRADSNLLSYFRRCWPEHGLIPGNQFSLRLKYGPSFVHHLSSQWNRSGTILPSFICYSALPFVGLLLWVL